MSEEIIVTGTLFRYESNAGGSGGGGGSTGEGGDNPNPTLSPDPSGGGTNETVLCQNVDEASDRSPPDNARYLKPVGVTVKYMVDALTHIAGFSNRTRDFWAVKNEIVRMYTDKTHPHFVDFKDWGTDRGPVGALGGGSYSYYSQEEGKYITAGAFEAFGNYFFGVVCTYAGFSADATQIAAAWSQEGGSGLNDDPRDQPHVSAGIRDATRFLEEVKTSNDARPIIAFAQGCRNAGG